MEISLLICLKVIQNKNGGFLKEKKHFKPSRTNAYSVLD
jgi:hypothetical protein